MKKFFVFAIVIFGIINLSFSILVNFSKPKPSYYNNNIIPNVVIIKYKIDAKNRFAKDQNAVNSYNSILARFGINKVEALFPNHQESQTKYGVVDLSRFFQVHYTANVNPYEVVEAFSGNPLIEYSEPVFIRHLCYTPNDVSFSAQWSLKKIQAEKAWDISKGDSTVIIGIVDTGIDWLHPDLANNIWINKGEVPNNGIDDDKNGYIDDVRGWDFGGQGNGNQPTPDNDPNEDKADHGSHVAGIACAVTDNLTGVSGVGFNCRLMPVKVTQNNQRTGGGPDVLYGYKGIVYAADNGADIINCSWGGGGYSKYESEIILYANQKGALVVASAGNDYEYANSFYPSAYNHVLAVGSTTESDTKSSFSNYGPYVDVSAPGTSIFNTWKGSQYTTLDGTSMSSPCAAGVAALVKSHFPNYTPDQVGEQVRISCDKIDSINSNYAEMLGYGRINAYKALIVSSPSIRIISYSINDTVLGNGNGIIEPGEKAQIKIEFINYLKPTTNLTISFTSKESYVKIADGNLSPGTIGTLQKFNHSFEFQADNSIPFNLDNVFMINYKDNDYNDLQQIAVNMNPNYANSDVNNIDVTITSAGNIGFNDYSDNLQGGGFKYKKGENVLFEGSLMFGTSTAKLSDAARGANQENKDNHFNTLRPITFSTGNGSDLNGLTIFNDALNQNKLNIKTTLKSYAWKSKPYDNFVILSCELLNEDISEISNFYTGLFFDWDIGPNGDDNIAQYDSMTQMGYAYNNKRSPLTMAGVAPLNYVDKINFRPILNNDNSDWQIYDGFSTQEKFQALSGGVMKSPKGPGDISMVIGVGPFTIPAGGKITVYFAMIAADTLPELQNSCKIAREKLAILGIANENRSLPNAYSLYQNYPNPFNPTTMIKFNLKESGNIKLQIYDIKGSIIKEMEKSDLQAGENIINMNFAGYASGVYFYRLIAFDINGEERFRQSRKMILMR